MLYFYSVRCRCNKHWLISSVNGGRVIALGESAFSVVVTELPLSRKCTPCNLMHQWVDCRGRLVRYTRDSKQFGLVTTNSAVLGNYLRRTSNLAYKSVLQYFRTLQTKRTMSNRAAGLKMAGFDQLKELFISLRRCHNRVRLPSTSERLVDRHVPAIQVDFWMAPGIRGRRPNLRTTPVGKAEYASCAHRNT